MGVVMFYHLITSTAEDTAAKLLGRALGQSWRVMVRGTNAARLAALDTYLWQHPDDGFLPHGLAGGPHDAEQPVLLGTGTNGNEANCLMLVDGAEVEPVEAEGMDRVLILFDGNDEAAVAGARIQWKAVTAAGLAAQYWSDASGQWEKKAG